MWVLALILGILFAVFLCILLLLAIPVDLVFHVERDTGFHLRISVRWLFGLVGRDIRRKKEKAEPEKTEEATNLRATATRIFGKARQVMGDEHEREQWNKRRKNTKSMLAMVQTRGFPRKILRFVIDSIRLVRIHRLSWMRFISRNTKPAQKIHRRKKLNSSLMLSLLSAMRLSRVG